MPLVNVVRKPEQESLLRDIGANLVCDSSKDSFAKDLKEAILEAKGYIAFDATGGGDLANDLLTAMEAAASAQGGDYSRYGSDQHKQVYIYGGLDPSPTILKRSYGMSWGLGGWLLMPMLKKIGMEKLQEMRVRVAKEIKTTFASGYGQEISFEEMLQPEIIQAYAQQKTGNKFLVNPQM